MPSKRYSLVRGLPPLMRGSDGIRRQGDARRDGGEHDEQAAVQRQLHDLFMLDDRPQAGGFGAHDRRVADDRHLFSNVSDADVEIDARFFSGRQADAFAAHRLEARQLEIEAVFARRQARGSVDTVAGGNDDALPIGLGFRDGDRCAGNGSPILIFDTAGDFAGGDLRPCRHRSNQKAEKRDKTDRERSGSLDWHPGHSTSN